MTVAVQTPTISYLEDGSTTVFPVPFRYDSPADLRASRQLPDGTIVQLANGASFTATPGPTNAGGALTLNAAGPAGSRLTIFRRTARSQTADYVPNGPFDAESHERALDRAMLVAQELDQDVARAPKVEPGQTPFSIDPRGLADGDLFEFRGGKMQRFDAAPFAGKFYAGAAGSGLPIPANGLGTDTDLRTDLAGALGALLMGYTALTAPGVEAVAQNIQTKLRQMIDRRDYPSLQTALNLAATFTRALYLGDEDFTLTSPITLPNTDVSIIGPGSGALTITYTGTGAMFQGTNLSSATNIDIGGFRAMAGATNCGRPIRISYASSIGIDVRAVHIWDVVTEFNSTGSNYWSGGPYITNARNSIIENCYTHGPTINLTHTVDGFKIDGEATDVKIINTQVVSVGTALDIGGAAEGTIITGFIAVDVDVGVSKSHTGNAEPWIAMTNWHINARKKGVYLNNVLQSTIEPGLIYCQNGEGNFIGVHVDSADVLNQDLMIEALVDGQLAGAGVTSTTGIKIDSGNGINAKIKMRSLDVGANVAAGVTNTILDLDPNSVTTIVTGAGVYAATNRIKTNLPGLGYGLPATSGPFNADDRNVAPKVVNAYGFGRDTTGSIKATGGVRMVAQDSNWVNAQTEVMARRGDALVQGLILFGTGSPEGVVTAPVGALYTRDDGGVNTTLYVKESGSGNTGWAAK